MSRPVPPRLLQIMAMVEALSPDEQRLLVELIHPVGQHYPLRGKPIYYTDPFQSVAENDWEALNERVLQYPPVTTMG